MRKYLKEKWKEAIIFYFMILCYATSFCYAVRAFLSFMIAERFWPAFGYILFACPVFSVGAFLSDYLNEKYKE